MVAEFDNQAIKHCPNTNCGYQDCSKNRPFYKNDIILFGLFKAPILTGFIKNKLKGIENYFSKEHLKNNS